jgi:hypothetical protein
MKPHKHSELIKQWADGAEIQFKNSDGQWEDVDNPTWYQTAEYRAHSHKHTDVFRYMRVSLNSASSLGEGRFPADNVKFVFYGKTGILKEVEVIK